MYDDDKNLIFNSFAINPKKENSGKSKKLMSLFSFRNLEFISNLEISNFYFFGNKTSGNYIA